MQKDCYGMDSVTVFCYGDRYLLALARVNNALAARADAVVRVVCGIPVYYKGVEK